MIQAFDFLVGETPILLVMDHFLNSLNPLLCLTSTWSLDHSAWEAHDATERNTIVYVMICLFSYGLLYISEIKQFEEIHVYSPEREIQPLWQSCRSISIHRHITRLLDVYGQKDS